MGEIRLTDEQRMAVTDRGGSLLVSAAAGSGTKPVSVRMPTAASPQSTR